MQKFREELHLLPFLKILIPFVIGIITSKVLIVSSNIPIGMGLGFVALLFLSSFIHHHIAVWLKAFSLFGLLLCTGLFRGIYTVPSNNLIPISVQKTCIVEMQEGWRAGKKSARTVAHLLAIEDSVLSEPIKIQLFTPLSSSLLTCDVGSQIIVRTTFSPIRNPGNPYEFDYATYLARQGVFYSGYVDSANYRTIRVAPNLSLIQLARVVQSNFLDLYRGSLTPEQFGVASALTLGYRDALDPEIKQAFSSSGAMHILAVSGLHVGVVYWFILLLFRSANFVIVRRYLRPLVVILILWGYAFITGLSPSVQRAALMLSVFVIGDSLAKGTNFFNKLAFTALILLFIKPSNLFDVGFQLSFTAVMSIVYFQQYAARWFRSKWWLLNYFTELIMVSFIAQVGTLGFSLFYFHQFPNYFLITNLFAVPIAFALVQLAVIIFIASCFSTWLTTSLLWLFGWLIDALVYLVARIESFPHATTTHIIFTPVELSMFYFSLTMFGAYLAYRTRLIRTLLCIMVVGYFLVGNISKVVRHTKAEFVVFNVNKQSCLAYKNNRDFILLSDSLLSNPDVQYATLPYRLSNYIDDDCVVSKTNSNTYRFRDFIHVGDKRILQLSNNNWKFLKSKVDFHVDWLILSNNTLIDLADLKQIIDFDLVIIDSSYTKNRRERMQSACLELGIPSHVIQDQGAFVYRFLD